MIIVICMVGTVELTQFFIPKIGLCIASGTSTCSILPSVTVSYSVSILIYKKVKSVPIRKS